MDYGILPPTDDWIFKLLFGDERRKSTLVDLLKTFVDLPEEEYELTFLDTHLKPEFEDDKLGIVDVKLRTKAGKIIDIEIQVCPVPNIGKRLSFYKSKLIVGQIDKSEGYEVIQKVICICITNHVLFPGVTDYLNQFRFYNRRNNLCFEDIPEELFTIELPKVPTKDDGSPLWDWAQFLRARTKEEFEMIAAKNPEIRKAVDTLYEISADPAIRAEYEQHEKARRDWINWMNGARQKGRQEGEQNKALAVARKAVAEGLPVELISKLTGLSPADIMRL
jgi:predicted transposase/invertase (TIGR01784 family)